MCSKNALQEKTNPQTIVIYRDYEFLLYSFSLNPVTLRPKLLWDFRNRGFIDSKGSQRQIPGGKFMAGGAA